MATASHQTLARYDDNCLSKYRARTLDDIRSYQREILYRARFHLRCLKMIRNRPTLIEAICPSLGEEGDSIADCDELHYQLHDDPATSSSGEVYSQQTECPWEDSPAGCSDWSSSVLAEQRCNAPSPAWSSSSSVGSTETTICQQIDDRDLPRFFFETPIPSPASRSNKNMPPNSASTSSRQSAYKQGCNPSSKPSIRNYRDNNLIISEFKALKNILSQNCSQDSSNISKFVHSNWQVILKAMQSGCPDIIEESISLINELIYHLEPETVLHMLQHGLVFELHNAVFVMGYGFIQVIKLLISIINSAPSCIPYLIELMTNSKILTEIESNILYGSHEELTYIVEFYNLVTKSMISPECPQHLMPDILLATGVSKQMIESYGPRSTLQKCLTPSLIRNLIKACINRSKQREENLISMTLFLLANTLNLVRIAENTDWAVNILCAIRDSQIEENLQTLIKGLDRLAHTSESSEHCSQGVDIGDSSTRIAEQCRQYLCFHTQLYAFLLSIYSQSMANKEPSANSHIDDLW